MTQHAASSASPPPWPPKPDEPTEVTLRDSAELVDALPYLLGFRPDDSIVVIALHGPGSRLGGRLRFDIPERPQEWQATARGLAEYLVTASRRGAGTPDGALVFLCSDPGQGQDGRVVMERLRPLAQQLRTACGALDVPVREALCVSGGRWWSYVRPGADEGAGEAVAPGGTSVMAAAAAFAGVRVRGGLRELATRFAPLDGGLAASQERALDVAAADLAQRILGEEGAAGVRRQTAALLVELLERFRGEPPGERGRCDGARSADERPAPSAAEAAADRRDDGLVTDAQAARAILGLQDKVLRDRAAEWMEPPDAGPALRLWRALARRCVGAYRDHAAPPLALAGWVSWSSGDEAEARVALHRALTAEPDYTFALLLHEACNEGLDPEPLRECLRAERLERGGGG